MIPAIAFAVTMGTIGALEVDAPAGCLDPIEVAAAIDEIGGIDVAETVTVRITPALDEYALVVDIALVHAAPLHREVPLRPRECADVADLVAVLVESQRRAALEERLRAPPMPVPAPLAPREALPAGDPRTRPAFDDSRRTVEGWSPCDGPATCGGFRLGLGLGPSLPFGARAALDAGYDVDNTFTVIAVGEAAALAASGLSNNASGGRAALTAGLAWRTKVEVAELSVRALLGAGTGVGGTKIGPQQPAACLDPETGELFSGSTTTTYFLAPTAAVRGRIGYLYAEAGAFWHVGLDDIPGAYLALGFVPFGG